MVLSLILRLRFDGRNGFWTYSVGMVDGAGSQPEGVGTVVVVPTAKSKVVLAGIVTVDGDNAIVVEIIIVVVRKKVS